MRARIFKSGKSMAVRVPAELAFGEATREVEIERQGDTLILRPIARRSLAGIEAAFASFPAGFMVDGRRSCRQRVSRSRPKIPL